MIILNEKKYIKDLLNDDLAMITDKPKQIIELLAIYYHQTNENNIAEKLIDFLAKRYPKYSENKRYWNDFCKKIITKTKNKKLLESDGIPITEKEIKKINEIDNLPDLTGTERKALQRLLFSIVVLGKYQNMKSNNYGYISSKFLQIKTIDLFKIARVSANKQERLLLLNQLYNHKFIEFPKSYKDNCRASFLDDETTTKMMITDMRELGYQWNSYRGDHFHHCTKCGIMVKTNSGKDGMCSDCAKVANQTTAKCEDCGLLFSRIGKKKKRCDLCQNARNLQARLEWQRIKRNA